MDTSICVALEIESFESFSDIYLHKIHVQVQKRHQKREITCLNS